MTPLSQQQSAPLSGLEKAGEDARQYLTFRIGGEHFAVAILEVQEIIEVSGMTRVPMTPAFIRGVMNLRGNVVPVVDLSARLGRQRSDINERTCIVLVEVVTGDSQQAIGLLVDEVDKILDIPDSHLQPAPDFGNEIRTDFIDRMGRIGEAFIIVLAINNVLAVEELSLLEQFTQQSLQQAPEPRTTRPGDLEQAVAC